jgi:hypothetical protein
MRPRCTRLSFQVISQSFGEALRRQLLLEEDARAEVLRGDHGPP